MIKAHVFSSSFENLCNPKTLYIKDLESMNYRGICLAKLGYVYKTYLIENTERMQKD